MALALAATSARAEPPAAPEADYAELSLSELMDLDVVYGASAHQQKVSEAPSAVTVITAQEIRDFGYRTLGEALASACGVFTTNDRNYTYLGVRGFNRPGDYSTRVLILVDGHRANDAVVGQATVGFESPLDLDVVERIEVIRGPTSSLYGASAFFGVINLVTRRPAGAHGTEVSALMGNGESIEGRIVAGRSAEQGPSWLIFGSGLSVAGSDLYYPEYDDPATNNGIFEDGDWERAGHAYGKLVNGPWTMSGYFARRDKGIPTASYGTVFNDPRAWTFDGRGALDACYEGALGAKSSIVGRLSYDWFDYHGDYPYDTTIPGDPPTTTLTQDLQTSQTVGADVRVSSEAWKAHRLIAGTTLRSDFRIQQAAWDADPYRLYLDDSRSSNQWALYAQDEVALARPLTANLGLRYDHYQTFGGAVSPRLALIATLARGTTLKGLYGKGFRAPSPYELYYNDGGFSQKGNPELDPERMTSFEVVLEHARANGVRAVISGYRNRVENLITMTTDPSDNLAVFQNDETIDSRGLEVELDGRLAPGVRGRLSYALQATRDRATDALLSNSPQQLAKLNLRFPLGEGGWSGALELLHTGPRRTLQGNELGDFTLANVTILQQVPFRPFQLGVGIRNLFNTSYADPGSEEHAQDSIPGHGRMIRVWMTHRL